MSFKASGGIRGRSLRSRLCLGILCCLASVRAETILIRDATILTITQGTLQGSILIRDGKIAQVDQNVAAPPEARVIDASGQ